MIWFLTGFGLFLAGVLLRAWRLDRQAAARGLVYVAVKEKGLLRRRSRMVLVDRESRETEVAERLFAEQQAERERLRTSHPAADLMTPRLRRRRR